MANYKFIENSGIIRYSDGASIPKEEGNRDWREYLKYIAEGGLTDPWKTDDERLKDAKEEAIGQVKQKYAENLKIPIVTTHGTFNGGESSAAAINGVIQLYKGAGKPTVKITDIDNKVAEYTYEAANSIVGMIGWAAQEYFFEMQAEKVLIKEATTLEEL